ncbi:MAG: Phosphoglucomutase [Opitutia bacterium UBA7350]|nr:MAG: Phosphoglucomutase [Opitutae bacterium UBA7350]
MSTIKKIEVARASGELLESTVSNLTAWAKADYLPEWVIASINELVEQGAWEELNDRFYRELAFGTGGMRGRTIGKVCTSVEQGSANHSGSPAFAAVGSNVLNDFNIVRATIGLYQYVHAHLVGIGCHDRPRFVIAHDVRHFSRHFCLLAASTWNKLGGQALIFDGPRSTPQLSFAVREYGAHCGAVITASHNPPHDNGFKVYFDDGAQVVAPHAEAIVEQVQAVGLEMVPPFLEVNLSQVVTLGADADAAYLAILEEAALDAEIMRKQAPKVVFTPIHGTGGISSIPALQGLGVEVIEVPEQAEHDGRFPSVQSPNPENAEALKMAMEKAEAVDANVVLATDPDADRMGVAVRDDKGKLILLSGNQIGTLLAEYRISTLKESGVIPEDGSKRVALIKTFVTSPMQEALAKSHGIKTVNTLTGFKWIGEKLADYEAEMKEGLLEKEGVALDYDRCDLWTRADLLMDYATFFVFGGEESYGYLASDRVRDKDANAAVVMFCEMVAYLQSQQMTVPEYLDSLYLQHGYFLESTINIYYEGAAGSQKIANILAAYRSNPPVAFSGLKVTGFTDFRHEEIIDVDGKPIPSQDFYFLELENGYSFAVRGSGTEPKIKFYLFGRSDVANAEQLSSVKVATADAMQLVEAAIEADARERAEV